MVHDVGSQGRALSLEPTGISSRNLLFAQMSTPNEQMSQAGIMNHAIFSQAGIINHAIFSFLVRTGINPRAQSSSPLRG